ncbi:hypothetical protein [Pseudarthrobacter sp. S9]|uniref:hypothetical protein n=1 Tax=Pseudarthrobacter sp. S9 TaxID=3418421 RepID=UPI003D0538DE
MSHTVEIPGGTAELFDRKELTPRRRIPAKAILYRADDLLTKIAMARRVETPSGVEENPALDGPAVRLTQYEAETLEHLQYATTWGWLKSWTLDIPLPATWEDLLDIPSDITDSLNIAVQKLGSPDAASDFEINSETLADKESFTGRPGDSKTSSAATGKRRSSTPKR